ncbi:MAG: phosphate ABC transporter substrate-binding protein [Magnetococcales bacterium]|nr:phosphate ABC transporter substrate-binding protein [Magnetococcales bacterium]
MYLLNKIFWLFSFICVTVIMLTTPVMAELVVITSSENENLSLTKKEIKKLFLGKKKKIKGVRLVPVDQTNGTKDQKKFIKKVLNKTPKKLKAYWARKIFSGKGTPPQHMKDALAVKEWIKNNPQAIGYIDDSDVENSLHIVYKVK